MQNKTIYEISAEIKVSHQGRCTEFLGRLLEVLNARPGYLRETEVPRYATLVSFFDFVAKHLEQSQGPLHLDSLGEALRRWIWSARGHPLMQSYCLDTARLIEMHAYGQDFEAFSLVHFEGFELKSLIAGKAPKNNNPLEEDRELKGSITSFFKNTLAYIEIPTGAGFRRNGTFELVRGSGRALVTLRRCHLSSTGGVDDPLAHFFESHPPRHELMQEFKFDATLWPAGATPATVQALEEDRTYSVKGPSVGVPGRLVTSVIDPLDGSIIPVPQWQATVSWETPEAITAWFGTR